MKEESDSPSVPYNFSRCFNDQCPQASKCLRHVVTQDKIADYLYISIVNPARYPADGNQCECFKTAVKVHVAWGLKRLLDRIPYEDAVSIRIQMVGHYGKRDIIDSIVENGGLCLKTKPTSDNYSAIKG